MASERHILSHCVLIFMITGSKKLKDELATTQEARSILVDQMQKQ
ncbi:hypothetical protein OQH61_05255 [Helicobacter sp. MIT 21-1697]|nr:hypothetical protein [Helicobacter sp. MIT 21-1697]MCX2717140.1 hypothetical protein [Helicobacter sp. MIT 21-1697]